jgi:hypothetical protein
LWREVLHFAQDFACGLGRPQSGSSSSPAPPTTIASSSRSLTLAKADFTPS